MSWGNGLCRGYDKKYFWKIPGFYNWISREVLPFKRFKHSIFFWVMYAKLMCSSHTEQIGFCFSDTSWLSSIASESALLQQRQPFDKWSSLRLKRDSAVVRGTFSERSLFYSIVESCENINVPFSEYPYLHNKSREMLSETPGFRFPLLKTQSSPFLNSPPAY